MAHEIKNRPGSEGGLAYWSICNGRFEVWDRGDGIAEICPVGIVGVVTPELVGAWGAFDKSIGRETIPVPVGFPIHAGPFAFVHGHCQPDQDETGCLGMESAFPGCLSGVNLASTDVADIDALEAVLGACLPA